MSIIYDYLKSYSKHKKKMLDILREEIGLKFFYFKDNIQKQVQEKEWQNDKQEILKESNNLQNQIVLLEEDKEFLEKKIKELEQQI